MISFNTFLLFGSSQYFSPIDGEKHATDWLGLMQFMTSLIVPPSNPPNFAEIVCPRYRFTATENAGADEKYSRKKITSLPLCTSEG